MAAFVKGAIVVVPFPFSDLTQAKRRPAVVLAPLTGEDMILCQITSQAKRDQYAIPLGDEDFAAGGLRQPSNIRPNKLFTADTHIVLYEAGRLKPEKLIELIDKVIEIVRNGGYSR